MATIKIIGASHPGRFARELGKNSVVKGESTERYLAEFLLAQHRCRVLHDYTTGEIFLWLENEAIPHVLKKIISLDKYLGRALIVGVLPGFGLKAIGEAFIRVPGGKVEVARAGEGLWIGWDGNNSFFSATIQGLAELIEVLGERP